MNKLAAVVGIFLLMFSWSCKRKNITSSIPRINADTTRLAELNRFTINEIDFTYLHFKSKVEYVSGVETQNFTVNGRVKKDSIIWLSITPGLGIEAARCVILKDSVLLLDRIHNKLYTYGFNFINTTFNTQLDFYNLQALLVGNLSFPKESTDELQKQEVKDLYRLHQDRGNLQVDNYVQARTRKVEQVEVLNIEDKSALTLKYSEFAPLDSFLFANHIKTVVNFADEKGSVKSTSINIQHNKAEIVTKPLNFPFNVPKRFEDK